MIPSEGLETDWDRLGYFFAGFSCCTRVRPCQASY